MDTHAAGLSTHEAIRARRAVKHFDAAHVMPAAHEALLIDLARQAPTSFNLQNWRAVNVKDKALRAEIRAAAWNQAQVTDASLLFVFAADLRAHTRDPARYWANAPKEAKDILVPLITPFYEGRDWLARDEGMRSVGFAAQTVMLAAKALGYDSCPMIGFDLDAVAKLVRVPPDHAIAMMLAVGVATKPAWPKPGFIPLAEVVHTDRFPG
jgi:nitroreductase